MRLTDYFRRVRAIWNPPMFQGWGKKRNYFEGWYYKLVTADQEKAYAIIPGIALHDSDRHAFIQTMDGISKTSEYHRFNLPEFTAHPKKFDISIGPNRFSDNRLFLDLPNIHGELSFNCIQTFQSSIFSPGIMGWYSFVPMMQCYHGLVSIHHSISGELIIKGNPVDFSGGKGYIEKDWGSSFPLAWVWTQCNNYEGHNDLSVMASIAHIPWLGTYFIGFLAIVFFQGQTKIFTTYTKAEAKLDFQEPLVHLKFWDKHSHLSIKASQEEGTDLLAPKKGAMTGRVNESLMATHSITFVHDNLELSAHGTSAGLEVGGNSLILLNQT